MPTYEYECQKCGAGFERFQQMSDDPVRVCPECGKRSVKRLLGAGGAIITKRGASDALPCGASAPCRGPESPCGERACGLS